MHKPSTDFMTSAEAAEALQVSIKTITRWAASGKLTPVKRLPGRRGALIFAASDVAALISAEPWDAA